MPPDPIIVDIAADEEICSFADIKISLLKLLSGFAQ
jgi:hypothetical protein